MKTFRLLALFFFLIVGYSNCAPMQPQSNDSGSLAQISQRPGNGDIYMGFTFSQKADQTCSDGQATRVKIEFVTEVDARLLRENCAPVTPPRLLSADEVQKVSTVEVRYANQSLLREQSLAVNGSFEDRLQGWSVFGGDPQIVSDASNGVLALQTRIDQGWSWVQQGIDPILVPQGTRYRLTATAKTTVAGNPVVVAFKGSTGEMARLSFAAASFETKVIEFVAPAGLTWTVLFVEMVNNQNAVAGVDAISLVAIP